MGFSMCANDIFWSCDQLFPRWMKESGWTSVVHSAFFEVCSADVFGTKLSNECCILFLSLTKITMSDAKCNHPNVADRLQDPSPAQAARNTEQLVKRFAITNAIGIHSTFDVPYLKIWRCSGWVKIRLPGANSLIAIGPAFNTKTFFDWNSSTIGSKWLERTFAHASATANAMQLAYQRIAGGTRMELSCRSNLYFPCFPFDWWRSGWTSIAPCAQQMPTRKGELVSATCMPK